jgi:thiol-disulfide isomerase/thioredoxin
MPPFDGATEWVTGSKEEAEALVKGHPTLVHFWSVSCGICKEQMPTVSQWRDQHGATGLRVVAVHMPRYPEDVDVEAVRRATAQYGITESCAIDNEHKLRDAFINEQGYVPAYYLFDSNGKLKSFAAGERGLDFVGPALKRLLETLAVEKAAE